MLRFFTANTAKKAVDCMIDKGKEVIDLTIKGTVAAVGAEGIVVVEKGIFNNLNRAVKAAEAAMPPSPSRPSKLG